MCIEYETEALRQGQIEAILSIDMLSWGQLQEARGRVRLQKASPVEDEKGGAGWSGW